MRDKHYLLQWALNRSQYSELFCSTVQCPNPRQEVKRSLNSQDFAFFNTASIGEKKRAAIQACATFCSHFGLKRSNYCRFGTGMLSSALPEIVQRKPPIDTSPPPALPHLVIFQDCSHFTPAHSAEIVLVTTAVVRRKLMKENENASEQKIHYKINPGCQQSHRTVKGQFCSERVSLPSTHSDNIYNAILSQPVMLSQASCNP